MKRLVATILIILVASNAYAGGVLSIARSQLGRGETCGDNCGEDVLKYTRGQNVAWCAGYVSWVMTKAGKMKGKYTLSAREFSRIGVKTNNPMPGDVIVLRRGKSGRLGHVGIVEKIYKDKIVCIEGNVGKFPAKVKRITYSRKNIKNLIGFYRIK